MAEELEPAAATSAAEVDCKPTDSIQTIEENSACATTGEVFECGGMIEPMRDANGRLRLLRLEDGETLVAPRVNRKGTIFEPATIDPTILGAMALPTTCTPCESVAPLLEEIARCFTRYAALEELPARMVARVVLSTWVVEALRVVPSLQILGPETAAGNQLYQILGAVCRHALKLTGVGAAGFRSLPAEWHFTLLLRNPDSHRGLQDLLGAARRPGEFSVHKGRLLDLRGVVVTYSEFGNHKGDPFAGIEVPLSSSHRPVEIMRQATLRSMAATFQNKLLGYRREFYVRVRDAEFDAPQFLTPQRDLAGSLGAVTPGDAPLQAEVVQFLEERDREHQSGKWTDMRVVVVEAILAFIHEGLKTAIYDGQIAKMAEAILRGRGEERAVKARSVGDVLRLLRLNTEPRDARGFKLLLTPAVCTRVHQLARSYQAPAIETPMAGCKYCESTDE